MAEASQMQFSIPMSSQSEQGHHYLEATFFPEGPSKMGYPAKVSFFYGSLSSSGAIQFHHQTPTLNPKSTVPDEKLKLKKTPDLRMKTPSQTPQLKTPTTPLQKDTTRTLKIKPRGNTLEMPAPAETTPQN